MNQFWELLKESVITQGVLTVLVVSAWLYIIVTGGTVPPELNNILGLIIGFYFGGKVAVGAARLQASMSPRKE